MKKIHTEMTYNNMKEWMQRDIINEAEEYAGMHKSINENEPYDMNVLNSVLSWIQFNWCYVIYDLYFTARPPDLLVTCVIVFIY